jgi:hypothetical protein
VNPLDILKGFASKQATPEEVMRALISWDGWFAPALYAAEAFGKNLFEHACVWGTESRVPPGHLWLFTGADRGPLLVQRGASPGPYVGPLVGATLFEKLPQGITQIEINPGSPPAEAFFVGAHGLPLTRQLGAAIGLESAFASGTNLVDRLVDYEQYILFITPKDAIATAVGAAGMQNPALVFTSFDCARAGLQLMGNAAASLRQTTMTGKELFTRFGSFGIDGLLVNAGGPGAARGRVLRAETCRGIAEQITARAELARLEALAASYEDS